MRKMIKKQVVVRTYPNNYMITTNFLENYLNNGYIVVMCNPFYCGDKKGNEYILEKEIEESEE